MSRERMASPMNARSFGRQSACSTKIGSRRLAASTSFWFVFFEAFCSRTFSYAIPAPWWMPSSVASRLQRSSSTVPRDERAMRRKREMISRS